MIDTVSELKSVIVEKNRVIDELKFILAQKDQMIVEIKQNHSLYASSISAQQDKHSNIPVKHVAPPLQRLNSGEEVSGALGLISDISQYVTHVTGSDKPLDQRDQIIRDFMHIIVQQLDWKKAHTSNPIIQRLLRPSSGSYSFDDGNYEGDMIMGLPNGKGRTVLKNGDNYEGEYLHGKKNGRGIYKWKNGDVYEGDHLEGQENGKGIYRYMDGDVYIGDYQHGKRHGFGMLKLKSGTTEYGYFRDGQYNGKCIMISPDEQIVSIGDLKQNKQDGTWKFYNMKDTQVYINGQKIA